MSSWTRLIGCLIGVLPLTLWAEGSTTFYQPSALAAIKAGTFSAKTTYDGVNVTSTKKWSGETPWTNLSAGVYCYQRAMGIGLRMMKSGSYQGGMQCTFDVPETVRSFCVSVALVTQTAFTSENSLVWTLTTTTGETVQGEEVIPKNTLSQAGVIDLGVNLETAVKVRTLSLQNGSRAATIDIAEVSWASHYPTIELTYQGARSGAVDASMTASILVSGGSGALASATWTYAGQTHAVTFDDATSGTSPEVLQLYWINPSITGSYPLVVTVTDQDGTSQTLEQTIHVRAFEAPTLQTLSSTETGDLTITWSTGGSIIPARYTVKLYNAEAATQYSQLIPKKALLAAETTPLDLTQLAPSNTGTWHLILPTLGVPTGDFRWEETSDWTSTPTHLLTGGALPYSASDRQLWLKFDTAPTEDGTLTMTFPRQTYGEQTLIATGGIEHVTFEKIPLGRTVYVEVCAEYADELPDTIAALSTAKATYEMPQLAPFVSIEADETMAILTWPTSQTTGLLEIYGEQPSPVPEGLYLSRIIYAQTSTGVKKAIVLTNTSTQTISLDTYYLHRATATTTFSLAKFGEVPAKSERLLVWQPSQSPLLPEERPTLEAVALWNFAPSWEALALYQDTVMCNTLPIVENAVTRLAPFSTTTTETSATITSETTTLPMYYEPWGLSLPQTLIQERTVTRSGTAEQSYLYFLTDWAKLGYTRVWAKAFITDGPIRSSALEIHLYQNCLKMGFRFSLQ